MNYKKILTRLTVAFVFFLLFLTFFSQTIADISVPRVVLEFAAPGAITTFNPDGTTATTNHAHVIPVNALRRDAGGYFILYAESVPSRFGSNYYLRLLRVEPGRRSFTHVAINTQWGMDMPDTDIVINSDIFVYPGARVRIVGEHIRATS